MNRRKLIITASSLGLLSGCADSSDNDIQDSDGDGVIDSEDYAPNDPAVQQKSDLTDTDTITRSPTRTASPTPTDTPTPTATASPTPTPTATETPTASPTPTDTPTPTATETPTPEANKLRVTDDYWLETSHVETFSATGVDAVVDPDYPETSFDTAKLYAGLVQFPRGGIVAEGLSQSFDRSDGQQRSSVSIDPPTPDRGQSYYYLVGLVPGSMDEDAIDLNRLSTIMETDAFAFDSNARQIERVNYDSELPDDSGDNYSRNNVEGAYNLSLSGRTKGENWTINFFAYKSAHADRVEIARGRSRAEYVSYELTEGTAPELARLLKDEADERGYSALETVAFVIDFVQAFPYVPDDVSKGFDDYTKFIMETVTEMGGDCEDSSILLASLFESEPFGYDTILIQPPGHMAVGAYQTDPDGYYWELDGRKYSYIETTGRGWGIGDCPAQYQDAEAYLYQV